MAPLTWQASPMGVCENLAVLIKDPAPRRAYAQIRPFTLACLSRSLAGLHLYLFLSFSLSALCFSLLNRFCAFLVLTCTCFLPPQFVQICTAAHTE